MSKVKVFETEEGRIRVNSSGPPGSYRDYTDLAPWEARGLAHRLLKLADKVGRKKK